MFRTAQNPYDDIVAKATDENQTSEDWGLLLTVWDKVNDDGPTGARNCVNAIQKRLQHRNANVQLYSLTLADSLVMNCKVDLHREISSRAFTQTLSRIVQDRTTHDKVKKRIMQLLKKWSEQFKKDETLGIVEETYDQLKKTYRFDDPSSEPAAVPVSVLKQEEEDIQRAIAESEALARNQHSRPGFAAGTSGSHGQQANSYAGVYGQPVAGGSGSNFFTQADGKVLPEIQSGSNNSFPQGTAPLASVPNAGQGPSRVKALYDFEPQEDGELAFRKGDIIRVVNSAYEGWWKGELDGRVGIFPLTYIEIIPDPTPESIARDAEVEAQVFAQAGNVDRLLAMLSAADAQGSSISDDDDLMELYHQCILMRPKIVKLLDKYSQKQKDLSGLHDKFKIAKTAYDNMLEESYQRNSQFQQPQPGQAPYAGPAYPYQPQAAQGAPPQSHYPGQQMYPGQPPQDNSAHSSYAPGPAPAAVQVYPPASEEQVRPPFAQGYSSQGPDPRVASPMQPHLGGGIPYVNMPQPGQQQQQQQTSLQSHAQQGYPAPQAHPSAQQYGQPQTNGYS